MPAVEHRNPVVPYINRSCKNIKHFKGVYSRDNIRDLKMPYKFIFNSDSAGNPGTHWVYVVSSSVGDTAGSTYFDPFGIPPPDEVKKYVKYYRNDEVQNINIDLCGEYCVYILKHVACGANAGTINKVLANLYS
jgi:hypothetical protein